MSAEMVILVDEYDNQLGIEEKMRAHSLGLLHRAFSVFVLRNNEGKLELLLQQRNADKYHCGNLWTNTCCSHPRPGETILAAAQRRLQEEMGFTLQLQLAGAFQYKAAFSNGLIEHEYDHVLVGTYDNQAINFNPDEVQAYKWIDISELTQDIAINAQQYTPWLARALALAIQTEVVAANE